MLRDALDVQRRLHGDDHPEVVTTLGYLAGCLFFAGKLAEAEQLLRELLALQHKAGDLEGVRKTQRKLIEALEAQGNLGAGEDAARELVALARRQFPEHHPETAAALAQLGANLLKRGKHVEAEPVLRECLEIRIEKQPTEWNTYNAMSLLGGALSAMGRHAEAEALLTDGYEKMQPPPAAAFRKREALERLICHHEARGATQQVQALRKLLDEGAK